MLIVLSNAYENGGSAMIPMSKETLFIINYNYLLGPDIFVSPIVEDNSNQHFVAFPLGTFLSSHLKSKQEFYFVMLYSITSQCFVVLFLVEGSDWVDWWNSTKVYPGGSNVTLQVCFFLTHTHTHTLSLNIVFDK
jgi:alpha-glucosidase (family GH31 glycosyl hydrolase)